MYSIRYFINFAINCNGRMHYNMIINTLCRLIILNDVIDALLLVHKRHDAKDLLYRYYTVVIFVSSGGGGRGNSVLRSIFNSRRDLLFLIAFNRGCCAFFNIDSKYLCY